MTDALVKQRLRLLVLDALDAVCDVNVSEWGLDACLANLIEDLCRDLPDERFGEALDPLLVDEDERRAFRPLLPALLRAYLDWDLKNPATHPHRQESFAAAAAMAERALRCMREHAWAQADAVRERQEGMTS